MSGAGPIRVVIAEEMALYRAGLVSLLAGWPGFDVVGDCGDGERVRPLVEESRAGLLLLDYAIPGIFALELTRQLRHLTRVVIAAPKGDRRTVVESLRSGASGFVLKNGDPTHLAEGLHKASTGSVYLAPGIDPISVFTPHRVDAQDPLGKLSAREYQVFSLLIQGLRAKEVAARLDLSPKTVDTYRSGLMKKLDIHDLAGLVKFAVRASLLPAE